MSRTVTATQTVTVNAAFLQEIKQVNAELWQLLDRLRHYCQRPLAPAHCRTLVAELSELRDQLGLHFSLEEAYGYFEDPAYVPQDVAASADKLRQEHQALYRSLGALVEQAEEMLHQHLHTELVLWFSPAFSEFDSALRDHESRENELIMEAYALDIGVGD